jgi:N-acetylneuraminic acid mutarotase
LGAYPAIFPVHEVYEPATKTWSQAKPMPTARGGLAAVTGPDGLIYAIGGIVDGNNIVATVEAYDPTSDTWTTKTQMHTPRAALAAVAVTNPGWLIYAIGGCTKSGGYPQALDSVEEFNITTNTWTPRPDLTLPAATKYPAGAVGPNGLVFVIGGLVANPEPDYIADVYSYDPTATGWAKRPPLPSGRAALAADTGPDGLVYAIGGVANPPWTGGLLADVEGYTYDKCDYIEYEIAVAGNALEEALNGLEDPVLTAQQRAAALKQIAGQRKQIANLLAQLKKCRQ